MKRLIFKEVIGVQRLTNYRALYNHYFILLRDVDDIIVLNSRRLSKGTHQSYGRYYRAGASSYSSKTIGDVLFMRNGRQVIYFRQIGDPQGVARLAKSARKIILAKITTEQKEEATKEKSTVKERRRLVSVTTKYEKDC